MRIDKFLWCIRLAKTRSEATRFCNSGKVMIDDEIVKPSKEVYCSAKISFKINPIWKTFKVIDIPKSRVGAKLVTTLIIETTPEEELDKLKLIDESNRQNRAEGMKGRPTKRDRRKLDDWND